MGTTLQTIGRTALLAAALLFPGPGAAWAQARELQPKLTLQPDPVGLGELVVLKIEVDDLNPKVSFDATFEVENLERVGGPIRLFEAVDVFEQRKTTVSLSWRLRPRAPGKARVFGVKAHVGSEEFSLENAEITVLEEPPPERRHGRQDPRDEDIFEPRRRRPRQPPPEPKVLIRAEVTPRNPWVGQQVLYTLTLYSQTYVTIEPEELPDFKGFWVHDVPPGDQPPKRVEYQGESYESVVLLRRVLFPRRAGEIEIPPAKARLMARTYSQSLFGSRIPRTRRVIRETNTLTLQVRPLPDAPPGFRGAIGRLSLDAELEPRALAVGEAATLELTLRGDGHLQGLPEPELPAMPGIKIFPPQQQAHQRLRGTTVVGERSWSFVLVPERPGSWQLPPIEVPYFDPRKGVFASARSEPLALEAKSATALPQVDGAMVELHSIRNAALPVARRGWRLADAAPWLFALPWLGAGAALLLRRRKRGGPGRQRPARQELLARLEHALEEDHPRRAAARIEEAWRVFLHRRWQIPPETPSTRWQELLETRGVKPAAAAELVQLGEDLHYLRYAPKLSSTDELERELVERSRKLSRMLR